MVKEASSWFYWRDDSLYLHIYLQARASQDHLVGLHGDALKICLTAPPFEGRANKYLVTFLARCLHVTERQIELVRGEHSRKKWIKINKADPLTLANLLQILRGH